MLSDRRIWWQLVPMPRSFVEMVCECIEQQKNVVIEVDSCPFWQDFKDEVGTLCGYHDKVTQIDVGELSTSLSPAEYLVKEFSTSEHEVVSRDPFIQLCKQEILKGRFIWIYNVPKSKEEEWLAFFKQFTEMQAKPSGIKRARHVPLIIELNETRGVNNAELVSIKRVFDIGDLRVFAECLLNKRHPRYLHEYIVETAAAVAAYRGELNVERCGQIVRDIDFKKDPIGELQAICSDIPEDILDHLLWQAQQRTLFYRIEMQRIRMVRKYFSALERLVPYTLYYGKNDRLGFVYENPYDLELTLLVQFSERNELELDYDDYKLVKTLRDYRNDLAHMRTLAHEDVLTLLKSNGE